MKLPIAKVIALNNLNAKDVELEFESGRSVYLISISNSIAKIKVCSSVSCFSPHTGMYPAYSLIYKERFYPSKSDSKAQKIASELGEVVMLSHADEIVSIPLSVAPTPLEWALRRLVKDHSEIMLIDCEQFLSIEFKAELSKRNDIDNIEDLLSKIATTCLLRDQVVAPNKPSLPIRTRR